VYVFFSVLLDVLIQMIHLTFHNLVKWHTFLHTMQANCIPIKYGQCVTQANCLRVLAQHYDNPHYCKLFHEKYLLPLFGTLAQYGISSTGPWPELTRPPTNSAESWNSVWSKGADHPADFGLS
jgi:hypothetical protein